MRAVRAGGDRQDAHELIRQHSIAAARAVKDGGERNDLLERLAADPAFGVLVARHSTPLLDPERFIGRAPAAGRRIPRTRSSTRCSRRTAQPTTARGGARMTPRSPTQPRCRFRQHRAAARCARSTRSDDDRLLLVATDRVSAFDVVMREAIPYKGAVLTQITRVVARAARRRSCRTISSARTPTRSSRRCRRSRTSRACSPGARCSAGAPKSFPVECVVRGYISGSAWKEYSATGTLAGEPLPRGLRESDRLDPPLFSPATKAETRPRREHHDRADARHRSAPSRATSSSERSLAIYERGRDIAAERGIIIADTKFEFGATATARSSLIDEVLTPDSSRFWPPSATQPGARAAELRQAAAARLSRGLVQRGGWNKEPPPPQLRRMTSYRQRPSATRTCSSD